jgi:cell division protein FtsB
MKVKQNLFEEEVKNMEEKSKSELTHDYVEKIAKAICSGYYDDEILFEHLDFKSLIQTNDEFVEEIAQLLI